LLIEINREETRGIIPGKVFEYLAAGRPILAVGPEKWDVERILEETGAGRVYGYEDKEKLKEASWSNIMLISRKKKATIPGISKEYSRRSLTGKMASLIKAEWE
jgi:hypothetical protein